jgi:hypothetical protein
VSTLMDPLDDAQSTLVSLLWQVFVSRHEFPVYNWVEDVMRRRGHDAAETIGGLPSIGKAGQRARYSAVWTNDADHVVQADSRVSLTMAGLFYADNQASAAVADGVLKYMRAMYNARAEIQNHLFDVPILTISLHEALADSHPQHVAMVGAVAEREYIAASVGRDGRGGWNGEIRLPSVDFTTIEEYLNAITAVCSEQRPEILTYRDPRALARAVTNFDITCELVLGVPLVKKPAISRTIWFGQSVASHSDLTEGISALGELLSDLQVPGRNPSHATGRLLGHLMAQLPKLNSAPVQDAIDLMDAVRIIRNSGQHPKPAPALLAAYDLLGLAFPIRNPGEAWDIIRAQMDVAFNTLQEEVYAAKP